MTYTITFLSHNTNLGVETFEAENRNELFWIVRQFQIDNKEYRHTERYFIEWSK